MPPLHFHIDQPKEWQKLPVCLHITGWCFAVGQNHVTEIHLTSGPTRFKARFPLPRPDVKAIFPTAPGEGSGFEIRATVPPGSHQLRLEARLSDGSWHPFFEHSVIITGRRLPRWLGGGAPTELIAFQMPAHAIHVAHLVKNEPFGYNISPCPLPSISIVTPSFNQAEFLPQTAQSVLQQSHASIEFIVQDGGSSDDSAAVIKKMAEDDASGRGNATIRWESAPDDGQADAIAKGFAKTSGGPDDVMAWINSDDFYLPGALGFVADYFARHPEVDVLYGHRILVDENSMEIGRWFLPKHDPEVLRLNDFVPQETLFWRRRIWDKVGGIDTSFRFAMDWDLLLRFQAAGAKIVRVPYFLACFRIHPAQKTSAQMHSVGQQEIDRLRERTFGRRISPEELESNPRLIRYLRKSAFIEFLWKLGIRAR